MLKTIIWFKLSFHAEKNLSIKLNQKLVIFLFTFHIYHEKMLPAATNYLGKPKGLHAKPICQHWLKSV